jgi:hypothetical protein
MTIKPAGSLVAQRLPSVPQFSCPTLASYYPTINSVWSFIDYRAFLHFFSYTTTNASNLLPGVESNPISPRIYPVAQQHQQLDRLPLVWNCKTTSIVDLCYLTSSILLYIPRIQWLLLLWHSLLPCTLSRLLTSMRFIRCPGTVFLTLSWEACVCFFNHVALKSCTTTILIYSEDFMPGNNNHSPHGTFSRNTFTGLKDLS